MLYHAGLSSLVLQKKIYIYITDSDLEIQNYKIEVQLKPKLHQLWRTALWLGKLQLRVFLKVVWVFWLKRLVPPLDRFFIVIKSRATCRLKSRCQSDLSTVSVLANTSLHQDLMHSGCRGTAVPNVCLQAFSLFPLPNSPLDQRPVHRLDTRFFSLKNHLAFPSKVTWMCP